MKKEKQVCTFEQAMELKKFGIVQMSHFGYVKHKDIEERTEPFLDVVSEIANYPHLEVVCSAFNAAELIQMNAGNSGISTGATRENKGKFYMQTGGFGEGEKPVFIYYSSFAEASAAKLINALENEWLDVETCNKRLLQE